MRPGFEIWYALAVVLLWLPPAALVIATGSLAIARLRSHACEIWLVALAVALCGFWAMFPSLAAAAYYPPSPNLLFHKTIGIFPAGLLQSVCGIITGVWVGFQTARLIGKLQRKSQVLSACLLFVISIPALFFCYIPVAVLEDSLGGGSGFGEGVPETFMWIFTTLYFPSFRWMSAHEISLHLPGEYGPVALSITGPLVLLRWGIRRFSED